MSAPLKIAMVGLRGIDESLSGGVERHVEELSTRMVRKGHDVTVFCRGDYIESPAKPYRGVKRVVCPCIHTKHLEAITHTMTAIVAARSYDIIHFHDIGPALLAWAPRLHGQTVVTTVHRLSYLASKWGTIAATALRVGAWTTARFSTEIITVSKELREHYREKMGREAQFIPNGVNKPTHREIDSLGRKFGLVAGEYILSLGRLSPEKGVEHLINAYKQMDAPLKLVVAGDALFNLPYAEKLKQLAGDDPRIIFTGGLYGAEKDEAFSNAAAFVMPSLLEGMPIAMLEAMSYGCPILTSDTSACAEVWQDAVDVTGRPVSLLSRTADPADIRVKLESLLRDSDRTEMGARAREFVLARYNWDDIADATLAVYEKAKSGSKAR